jgi:hypothetical protein
MRRTARQLSVDELVGLFPEIEFPEYQREPNIWSRDQKQRLVDSILRDFDVASVYLYEQDGRALECIDGRQRLNAIMAFMGKNPNDMDDDGFPLRVQNEISVTPSEFQMLDGKTHEELERLAESGDELADLAGRAVASFRNYGLTAIYLSEVQASEEFNLQFLRLNLGTLINAGEKLHAMVGQMRDLLFESDRIGEHPFFAQLGIPTRRFSKEQVAAQIMTQSFSYAEDGQFTRARHFDLQRFVKEHASVGLTDPRVDAVARTLDALDSVGLGAILKNRAIAVSVVLLAWERRLSEQPDLLREYRVFVEAFVVRLRTQVERLKQLEPVDERYRYLVDFQRNVTQASVEKPAVTARHAELSRQFDNWIAEHKLMGDSD